MVRARRYRISILTLLTAFTWLLACAPANATVFFFETFNGYTSFPNQIPSGDYVNPGLPKPSEGADEVWYGGRFEQPDSGTIDSDLAVQQLGGGTNNTHVGRMEDDAGLLCHVSTVGLQTATLSFDWRTFLAESTDRLKVGYYVGSLAFDAGNFHDWYADFGQIGAENWWTNNWTQILSTAASDSWHHVVNALPLGEADIWVAFWLDNGEGDYGKIDNVKFEGTLVPEPTGLALAGVGVAVCLVATRRRFRQRAA